MLLNVCTGQTLKTKNYSGPKRQIVLHLRNMTAYIDNDIFCTIDGKSGVVHGFS